MRKSFVSNEDGIKRRGADLYYYLQGANYNVVALLDENANVLVQYTYDPYGNLAAIDVDPDGVLGGGDPPRNAIAHQGLFFERFFGTAADLLSDSALAPADALTGAGPAGLYHNRNRWYSPDLGRFTSVDPNATALPIVTALLSQGDPWTFVLTQFAPESRCASGMNLYLYSGGNPCNRADPLGLWPIWTGLRVGAHGRFLPSPTTVVSLAGYFLGLSFANAYDGWGPRTLGERLLMANRRYSVVPDDVRDAAGTAFMWYTGTVGKIARSDLSACVAPVARHFRFVAGIGSVIQSVDYGMIGAAGGVGGLVIGATAAYAGVLDAVMWTIENDF